ncbi:MAG TPA: NAD(P)-dependent oxidoreductase [Armatimonadota bacterium]|nr:NAD(P)-dependent oxidoreductase [Armatimonadota bacterium]
MPHVLVTGGTGNVGGFVCRDLIRHGYQVTVFDRRPPARIRAINYAEGSILSLDDLRAAMTGIDAVVHLAAIPNPANHPADVVFEVNTMCTHRVLDAAAEAGVSRAVVASSDSTYGFVFGTGAERPRYLPIDEEHPTCPADPYGLSKLLDEHICAQHSRRYGMTTVALRFCWVWFPPDYPDPNALAADAENCRRTLVGYVDARDAAQAVRLALQTPLRGHETFLISARDTYLPFPTRDFIARAFPQLPELRQPARFMNDGFASLLSTAKAEHMLGYRAKHTWRSKAKG